MDDAKKKLYSIQYMTDPVEKNKYIQNISLPSTEKRKNFLSSYFLFFYYFYCFYYFFVILFKKNI